jgi:predicted RNA-binding Zn-ribbon protein involved in translation (DUF1610 family)
MNPTTVYDTGPLGNVPCPACGEEIYLAWDAGMNRIALDPDPDGPIAVALDGNLLPWCRDAAGTQLAFDDSFYRLHDPTCGLATVTPIGRAKSARRRDADPEPARRTAHAR